MNFIVVFVTVKVEEAQRIAQMVVREHLAGCVNIIPRVESIYFWEGKLCEDIEALLIIKTRAQKFKSLKEKILSIHSYEVPEIIALPIKEGLPSYLKWLLSVTY
jgi:periplasmic divalent cation tolerance protein